MNDRQIGMDDQRRSSVTVHIAGEEYTIRAVAAPEYTRRCAAHVDAAIRDVSEQSSLVESHKAAILAALSLTDRLFQAEEERDSLKGDLDRLARELTRRIEEGLSGGEGG